MARLATIAEDTARLADEARRAAARTFAEAAELAVPQIARSGFAAELASACQIVAGDGGPAGLALHVAPDDHQAVEEALAALPGGSPAELTPIPDPELARGEARIAWSGGGADISAARLAEAALSQLRRRLPHTSEEDRR